MTELNVEKVKLVEAYKTSGKYGMPVLRLKYNGIFDMNGLYALIRDWMVDKGYYFEEKSYKSKVPTPLGRDEEINISGWKKINDYVMYWITVYIHTWGERQVEVVREGKKIKLYKARMLIEFDGYVETDWQKKWNTQFLQYLKKFYETYIIKKEIANVWWDQLYYTRYKLHNAVKEFLNMQAKGNAYYDMW